MRKGYRRKDKFQSKLCEGVAKMPHKPISEFLDKIIYGNSLEILPTIPSESVDLILTDPPYNTGMKPLKKKKAKPVFATSLTIICPSKI